MARNAIKRIIPCVLTEAVNINDLKWNLNTYEVVESGDEQQLVTRLYKIISSEGDKQDAALVLKIEKTTHDFLANYQLRIGITLQKSMKHIKDFLIKTRIKILVATV